MGKNRKWQFMCIIAVMLLTVYNIVPTLFYYFRQIHEPINAKQSEAISYEIQKRVNGLEEESVQWIHSFSDLIRVHPTKVSLDPAHPQWISVSFSKDEEANRFRTFFPRAGALIPFFPSKLLLSGQEEDAKSVLIQRQIPLHLDSSMFSFAEKNSNEYQQLIIDRAAAIAETLIQGENQNIQAILTQDGHFAITDKNPIFSDLSIDFLNEKIRLAPHAGVPHGLLVSEIAKIDRLCNEKVSFSEEKTEFFIPFHTLENTAGTLVLHLSEIAQAEIQNLKSTLKTKWHPTHPDLQNCAIVDQAAYAALPVQEKGLCLILFSSPLEKSSLYLSAKGFERLSANYGEFSDTSLAHAFSKDLNDLNTILSQSGFSRIPPSTCPFAGDLLFEKSHFAAPILDATREEFLSLGSKKYALLDLSTREQRVLTENKIETTLHQELIQWKDDYLSAQVSLNQNTRFDTPKPTKSVFWNNISLTLRKMFRGDERKIIRWGLDLSGGKTVEIELRDGNHTLVESDSDLKQGIEELRSRVNKMGLSEVSIRQVGKHIVLDFPGSQSLSASELIKASTMVFHIVNEKFSPQSPLFGQASGKFLQAVWNEAVFSHKTDSQSINEIAQKHLASPAEDAKLLREGGLDLTSSKIVLQRGEAPQDWHGESHPLMIVFAGSALEGAHLENIHAAYDVSKGNYLSFGVTSSFLNREGVRTNPQNNLHAWTSLYSKENVVGTPNEAFSRGRGWRMAVVLNDTVISCPTLDSAIKDNAMVSGSFSQSEVQRLSADLKAGSLTFTPHILSEKNVSPELGQTDRTKGIVATIVALLLVIGCMVFYYRFAGLVASVAVLFNLLILWAVLQNLGATLTLAGIAGIILTVGMSIDANVLVFERIKEEFAITGRIASAITAGYNKAFSAIVDSNITTIIAALILLNFDAGPIKSFAMNLIIGIVSSMFTALFMTRFYFTGWAQNPKNTALKMAHWIKFTRFDFLKKTKIAFATATVIIITGTTLLFSQRSSILGLDFTGGYSLHVELEETLTKNYGESVEKALLSAGAEARDFQVREMNPTHQLRLLFAGGMDQKGKPFFGLPLEDAQGKNPKISWVVNALAVNGLKISKESLPKMDSDWTAVSSQLSDTMRNHAIFGFLLSFVGIFVYLAFRFEYKFAAAAIACLIHDVLITLALMGLLHACNVPIQIDLITIAAIMTAVGYSLNDTIIIFDRIREEMHLNQKRSLKETINYALNFTLSRTMITSGSTLLVLLALLFLGGASIFGFALVMTIGVVFGTLSSWFIAAPLMLFFQRREEKKFTVIGKI